MGKVVASHAEDCRVYSTQRLHRFILCARRSGGTAHRVEVTTSIGSTVSDAMVGS